MTAGKIIAGGDCGSYQTPGRQERLCLTSGENIQWSY
jgi:hypothetical protein